MREIILDTETTGLDPKRGDRIVEIGGIELLNRIPTGREFHVYINPERDMPAEAAAVHGLTSDFLHDKPLFKDIAQSFVDFIGNDTLVIHNASFDVGFLNYELATVGGPMIAMERVVDTLALARRKHPAGPNSLDALCKRYGIDASNRVKHGALIDCVLLADVYIELLGIRQAALGLQTVRAGGNAATIGMTAVKLKRPSPLPSRLSSEIIAAHRAYIATLGPKAIWARFWHR